MFKKIAVFSDVHGNAWALESVLRDIRRRRVDRIFNLGDSLAGPLAPRETAAMLCDSGVLSILGDRDRMLIERTESEPERLEAAFVRPHLDAQAFRWLYSLAAEEVFDSEIILFHGCPGADREYLFESVLPSGLRRRCGRDVSRRLAGIGQNLILCGHSHVFGKRVFTNGMTVVNPGSVGLPAFRVERPYPHVLEAGTPHARYALIERGNGGYNVRPVLVEYGWEDAAAAALDNGYPNWAVWLRTGRAKKEV